MSRPDGYYESIEKEAQEMAKNADVLDLARILVLARRQLREVVELNCADQQQQAQAQQPTQDSGE